MVCDQLGTPLALYDGRGRPTWQAALDGYGGVRQGRGRASDCPFRYQGQYEDKYLDRAEYLKPIGSPKPIK